MSLNPRISQWNQRVVWLIGASTGIGRSVAEQLARQGALVWISARSAGSLESFTAAHPGGRALRLDATDSESVKEAAQTICKEHGRIDMMVYCAGYYKGMRATQFDLSEALQHNRINYVGALNCLDAVLPTFCKQGSGHVSLVASVAGYGGLPLGLAYGPTKAALINLSESLFLDLQPLGIGVSVINPGFVETPMTAQNKFKMPALITAEESAEHIIRGWERGLYEIHFPKRFTSWLKLLRVLPRRLYFKMVHRFTGL